MKAADVRAALWQAIIERAEITHDAAVLGQRGASARSATRIRRHAEELAALARTVALLGSGRTTP